MTNRQAKGLAFMLSSLWLILLTIPIFSDAVRLAGIFLATSCLLLVIGALYLLLDR